MRLRTIRAAYQEIAEKDPDTALTAYRIKQMILCGELPCLRSGKKYLVNLDDLEIYLTSVLKVNRHE